MPKMRIAHLQNQRDKYAMHTDCKELIDKITVLTQDYWCLLSFGDKQQLLYVMRIMEKNRQMLPEYRYRGYEHRLNSMLEKYARKSR